MGKKMTVGYQFDTADDVGQFKECFNMCFNMMVEKQRLKEQPVIEDDKVWPCRVNVTFPEEDAGKVIPNMNTIVGGNGSIVTS